MTLSIVLGSLLTLVLFAATFGLIALGIWGGLALIKITGGEKSPLVFCARLALICAGVATAARVVIVMGMSPAGAWPLAIVFVMGGYLLHMKQNTTAGGDGGH